MDVLGVLDSANADHIEGYVWYDGVGSLRGSCAEGGTGGVSVLSIVVTGTI